MLTPLETNVYNYMLYCRFGVPSIDALVKSYNKENKHAISFIFVQNLYLKLLDMGLANKHGKHSIALVINPVELVRMK